MKGVTGSLLTFSPVCLFQYQGSLVLKELCGFQTYSWKFPSIEVNQTFVGINSSRIRRVSALSFFYCKLG